ncbi:hypothetical protein [Chondrinema litorale]|uniref:hypothetical protein n=1 Tax=Chondrinema litorale TaxID=2994555 RepID=UPI002542C593|nr:hypothetical protein [Chondrinema litorale]UZR95354.1 hypothetical protein OQ292_05915 [Chondrinema litorale]
MRTILKILSLIVAIQFSFDAFAQENAPQGKFVGDSIKLGEPVEYVLTYKHDPTLEVLFPDSTHDFSPFEFLDKKYFPTKTIEGQSVDSVVYTLTSFELDEIQRISIPVYIQESEKEHVINTIEDSIILVATLDALPDSVPLLTNTNMLLVNRQFNYPYLLIGLGTLFGIAVITFLIFGKQIRRAYKLKKLKKQFESFQTDFGTLTTNLQEITNIEKALSLWKHYSGHLINVPLASYTTKEIKVALKDGQLYNSLQQIDRAIYAGDTNEKIKDNFQFLEKSATEYYQQKVEDIRNG